jgi:hypothetical protein
VVIPEMVRIALLGGALALDRAAGWNFMLSQPLVGACLAGALVNPGPEWELWSLRVPIGVGALLQLLLTDGSLPAAQRSHDTATAGVVGSTVSVLVMTRLHEALPASAGGALWVVVGVGAGLLAAVAGGWVMGLHRVGSRADVARADRLAHAGEALALDRLYWRAIVRIFAIGAVWSSAASLLGYTLFLLVLPALGPLLTGRRSGVLLAALLGAAFASGYHAHARGRRGSAPWLALGGLTALVLWAVLRRPIG